VGRWLFRFVMMVDGLLGGNHASKAPPGGLLFLFAAVVGFTLAAVSVSAMG
jgi:hypothetical protein